ncbi:hypothetical protein BU17DRAFT_86515 [Hysterangium stoloniferum]|nr:hypothetical protein BU17DRAFT_86515 [Hysterangium stoloniferum]
MPNGCLDPKQIFASNSTETAEAISQAFQYGKFLQVCQSPRPTFTSDISKARHNYNDISASKPKCDVYRRRLIQVRYGSLRLQKRRKQRRPEKPSRHTLSSIPIHLRHKPPRRTLKRPGRIQKHRLSKRPLKNIPEIQPHPRERRRAKIQQQIHPSF